jgi:hypothetical protein
MIRIARGEEEPSFGLNQTGQVYFKFGDRLEEDCASFGAIALPQSGTVARTDRKENRSIDLGESGGAVVWQALDKAGASRRSIGLPQFGDAPTCGSEIEETIEGQEILRTRTQGASQNILHLNGAVFSSVRLPKFHTINAVISRKKEQPA